MAIHTFSLFLLPHERVREREWDEESLCIINVPGVILTAVVSIAASQQRTKSLLKLSTFSVAYHRIQF